MKQGESELVTCAGGLSLNFMEEGTPFEIEVKNNPKDDKLAGRCLVRVRSADHAVVLEATVEFAGSTVTVVYHDTFELEAGIYYIDAIYFDRSTRRSYDQWWLDFEVFEKRKS